MAPLLSDVAALEEVVMAVPLVDDDALGEPLGLELAVVAEAPLAAGMLTLARTVVHPEVQPVMAKKVE